MLSNVLIWYTCNNVEEHNCMFCTYTDVNHVELCDIFMCPSVTFRLLPSGLYSGKFTYQGMLYELSVFVFVLFCLFDATGIETSFRKQKYFFVQFKTRKLGRSYVLDYENCLRQRQEVTDYRLILYNKIVNTIK